MKKRPIRTELKDALRFNSGVRWLLSRIYGLKASLTTSPRPKLDLLCKSIRLCPPGRYRNGLMTRAEGVADSGPASARELLNSDSSYEEKVIAKGIILKPHIGDNEPGVIFISFEEQWARLLHIENLKEFSDKYRLVVSPTWSPPHTSFNYLFPRLYPRPIITLISNAEDLDYFPNMSKSYVPVNLYASSWVNPDIFHPAPDQKKDLDIVVVSNFGEYKRHFELFKALADMPKEITVTLVGQPNSGRTADDLLNEADQYGVRDRITLKESVSNAEVIDLVCRAKVSLVLSMREGSCVVVVESMFANTPVGLFEDAAIGSKAFINDSTGRLLPHRNLAGALVDFINDSETFSPRDWVMDNGVSCHTSSQTLNACVKKEALANGENWTQDIAEFYWHPDPVYVNDEAKDRMKNEASLIKKEFGIDFS